MAEIRTLSKPLGPAVAQLRGKRPKDLCIIVGVSKATTLQVERARSAASTWLQPYMASAGAESNARTVAFLYSRTPLFPEWTHFTLSLAGDLDLRHPKFSAHRFLYLWAA